jgi:hypothetical protein
MLVSGKQPVARFQLKSGDHELKEFVFASRLAAEVPLNPGEDFPLMQSIGHGIQEADRPLVSFPATHKHSTVP